MKYRRYFYITNKGNVISVSAKAKPSWKTMPRSGAWVVREHTKMGYEMPAFPEIVFETIKSLIYIGSISDE